MKNLVSAIILVGLCSVCASAQSVKNVLGRVANAATKGVQSFTLSDADVIAYTSDYMKWMDANNPVCKLDSNDKGKQAMAVRLEKITSVIPADLVTD